MKKLAIIAACLLASAYAYGQGTITFNNEFAYPGGAAFVDSNNNKTMDQGEVFASGPQYVGQLYGSSTADGSYSPIGSPLAFLTGEEAGYIVGPDLAVAGAAAGSTYYIKLAAWDIASPDLIGYSTTPAQVVLGGVGEPPSKPADLTGLTALTPIPTIVPEPSTIALGFLGLAALLIRRRS